MNKILKELKTLKILDFLLIIFIAIFCIFFIKNQNKKSNTILVNANGKTYKYSLLKDGIFSVQGELGQTTFEIKNNSVKILDSACKGKNCVHQKTLPLICLPNKISIFQEKAEFDALSE